MAGKKEEDERLRETRLGGEPVFEGRLLHVYRDRVRLPDGRESTREYIRHPGASAVVLLDGEGRVLLERQWRCPLSRAFWEIPAGKLDGAEDQLVCAKRELSEETGWNAEGWKSLGFMCPGIGYSNEVIHLFLARASGAGRRHLDPGEFLDLEWMPFGDAVRMALEGGIEDSKTIAALFRAERVIATGKSR